jgi:hypothetical protein
MARLSSMLSRLKHKDAVDKAAAVQKEHLFAAGTHELR